MLEMQSKPEGGGLAAAWPLKPAHSVLAHRSAKGQRAAMAVRLSIAGISSRRVCERRSFEAATLLRECAASGERMIKFDGTPERRKTDVRLHTYDGQILLTAARLYQGQTTNFRTPGGGFAPVFTI